jgi:hypothetical protein
MVLLCAKAFDMKKTAIILTAFIGCMFAACSKKDSGSPANKSTTVSVQNTTGFGYNIDTLYIAAFKDTSVAQINQDTAVNSTKLIKIGPLPVRQTSAPVTIDPMYKSYIVLFKSYNFILNRWLIAKVTSLADGTQTDPYIIKPGETKVIVLDANTKIKFLY